MIKRMLPLLSRYLSRTGSVSFWHTPVFFSNYDFSTLKGYYIDFSSKTAYKGPFEKGIPLLDYKGAIGKQFNPCATAQYGLGWYQKLIKGDKNAEKKFLQCAYWLRQTIHPLASESGVWLYTFDLDAYDVKAPWISGLSQAQGISLLLRAYLYTQEDSFLETAKQALNALITPIEKGGLLRREGEDVYLEEVVSNRLTGILDGIIFAIFGLHDYYLVTKDKKIKMTLDETLQTLKKNLPLYDLNFWSKGDLYSIDFPMIASPFYHNLHIEQLKALFSLTKEPIFEAYQKKWDGYQKSLFFKTKALIQKIYFKIRYY